MSTIRKTKLGYALLLTVVDLDISDDVRSGDGVTHLIRVVVASCKQVLALDLLTVMAETVTTSCKLRIFLFIGMFGWLSLAEGLPMTS